MNKKVVLITGASRGIGAAILTQYIMSHDYIVIGTSTSINGAELISNKIKESAGQGFGMQLDVCDSNSIDALLNQVQARYHQGVDVLINNAGITRDNLLLRMNDKDWFDVINTNLNAIYLMCKRVIKPMFKKKWGRIINIGSVAGQMGNAGQVNYAAAKAGLVAFSKSLAKEVASRGITVNTVAPGFVNTDMAAAIPKAQQEELLKFIPMKRFATVEEIAGVVFFLSSPCAAYITGETVQVNGGMHM